MQLFAMGAVGGLGAMIDYQTPIGGNASRLFAGSDAGLAGGYAPGKIGYRERYSREHRAFYLTDGFLRGERTMESEYADLVEDYGREEADEVMGMMYAHYETMAYLDTKLYAIDELMERTRPLCDIIETKQVVEPAVLSYVEQLVCGPWPDELFVRVGPHEEVPASPFFQPGSVR